MKCGFVIATAECVHDIITIISEAQRIIESVEMTMPGLAVVRLRTVGLERRAGHLDVVDALLKETVEQSKLNPPPPLISFYSLKLACFLHKLCKNHAVLVSVRPFFLKLLKL